MTQHNRRPTLATRAEFDAELREALRVVTERLAQTPQWAAGQLLRRQMEAMAQWSSDGRTPSVQERGRIAIGLVAVRELQDDDPLAGMCHRLNYYFQEWPPAGSE